MAESATVPLNPFCGTAVIVLVRLVPCFTLKLEADEVIAKRAAGDTVRLMAASVCKPPEVPVMKTVDVPSAAELLAVSVNVPGLVGVAALKDAVTPAGRPDAVRVTAPARPFCEAMLTVAAPPGERFTLAGDAAMVKAAIAVTFSTSRAVLVTLPEVPVIVIVDVDEAAEALAVSVSVLVVVALAGLNDAATPAGRPATLRATAPLKPCCGLMVIVLWPLVPGAIDSVVADEPSAKPARFDDPINSLIKSWPAGVPHPVARS